MDGLLFPLLASIGYSCPALLASAATLAWLSQKAPPLAPGRRQAQFGAGLILVVCVLQMALGVARVWLAHRLSTDDAGAAMMLFNLGQNVGILMALGSASGLALLGWGASQAMSGYRATS